MKHKWFSEIVAWANGEQVQVRGLNPNLTKWLDCEFPDWSAHSGKEYRIKPKHPHQAMIDAWKAGKKMQWRPNVLSGWMDFGDNYTEQDFIAVYEYRIKPVTHPNQNVIDAYFKGARIQWRQRGTEIWWSVSKGLKQEDFKLENAYRIKPHPNQDVFDAWKKGSKVQFRYVNGIGQWSDMLDYIRGEAEPQIELEYRFKPSRPITWDFIRTPEMPGSYASYSEALKAANKGAPIVRVVWNEDGTKIEDISVE